MPLRTCKQYCGEFVHFPPREGLLGSSGLHQGQMMPDNRFAPGILRLGQIGS
jgi:hypothetical protein